MTKEEYKEKMCKSCIYKNCNNDICEKHMNNMKIYRCDDYISIFNCNMNQCNRCKKCKNIGDDSV